MEENKQQLRDNKSIDKMSLKELQAECMRLREALDERDCLIAELNKKLEIRSKFDDSAIDAVALKREANEIRQRAMVQAQAILDEAKAAACKMANYLKSTGDTASLDKESAALMELPGADEDLGLGDLLLEGDSGGENGNDGTAEKVNDKKADDEFVLSPHEKIFRDYFEK